MKAPWSLVPVAFPLAAVTGGVLLWKAGLPFCTPAVLTVLAVVALLLRRREVAVMTAWVAVGCVAGFLRGPGEMPPQLEGRPACYSAVVERIRESESATTMTLRVDSVDGEPVRPFEAAATVPSFFASPRTNDRLRLRAAFGHPHPLMDLPDEIDPLEQRGMVTTIVPLDSLRGAWPEKGVGRALQRLRADVSERVFRSPLSPPTAVFINAVITGDTEPLTASDRERFAAAGLSHILALSGLHVGLIAWMAGALLFPFFPSRHSRARRLTVIAVVWVFAVMTGLSASVTRAAVMCTVVMAGGMLGRRHSSFNSLCLAALLILLFDPSALFTPGFQLTFAAVAGILAVVPLADKLPPHLRFLREVALMVMVPLAAVTATALISAYYFHTLPVHFLGANILVAWLMPPAVMTGLLAVATGIPAVAAVADALYAAIDGTAAFFASLPGFRAGFYPEAAGVVMGCAAIAFAAFGLIRRRKASLVMALMCVAAWGVVELRAGRPEDEGRVYFARSLQSFDVVVNSGGRLVVTTSARRQDQGAVRDRAAYRYRDFMGRRGIDSVEVAADVELPGFSRRADTLTIAGRRFCLLTERHKAMPGHWRGTVIATSRFRGDIVAATACKGVDTVMIAADMHPRRAARYLAELEAAGVSAVSLRDGAVSYTLY
nr:ComEC/Rec2 family competence protein [Bacteroides sp.]